MIKITDDNLDLTSLKKSITAFEKSLKVVERLINDVSLEELTVIKAGVIQHFEFCYELCWKFIKRWLAINISPDIADGVTRRELFRLGVENKLINKNKIDDWMEFHSARNRTSHIYDEEIAQRVFDIARKFLPYAKDLLLRLELKK